MKKIGLIILAAFFTYAAMAQTDIKVFDKIGPDAVLNKLCELNFFQEPEYFSSLHWTKSENGLVLENEKGGVLNPSVVLADNTYELIGFETTSDRFLFLTDYIPGGIKVGDSISKVQNVSFSDTEYGKGNPKNNCTKVFSSPEGGIYQIFGAELFTYTLNVQNQMITAISYSMKQDEPFAGYD